MSSLKEAKPPQLGLLELPEEVLYRILSQLRWFHLLPVSCTCKLLRRLADDDELWCARYKERWSLVRRRDVEHEEGDGDGESESKGKEGDNNDGDDEEGTPESELLMSKSWKERYRRKRHAEWRSLGSTFKVNAHPKDKSAVASIEGVIRFFEDEGVAGRNDSTGVVKYLFAAQFGVGQQTSRIHDRGGLPLAPKEAPLAKKQISFLISSPSLCTALMDLLAPTFVGVHLEEALRTFFSFVFPSSSTQLRDNLKTFAQAYYDANLGGEAMLQLPSAEIAYLLCNCAMMLSTDRHSGLVASKMKESEFIVSCRRCVGLESLPEEILSSLYARIQKSPPLVSKISMQ
eukprot:TRINITY_DN13972_c0_g1_i1.p1 TRINITY_DN13972_c0_g1~~TRINITY_DN13972_c0_g1_i1.p1  ORF type:complete len:384 (+),score=75.69 TRINITY_DN13972_c0_g1_i1:118-1152(+)